MSLRKPPFPRILLNNVSCMRNAQTILRNINVSVHDGSALVLTGANGNGKSTCFAYIDNNQLSLKDAIKDKLPVLDNVQWFELLEGKCGKAKDAIELMGLGRLVNKKGKDALDGATKLKRHQLARVFAINHPIWLLQWHWMLKGSVALRPIPLQNTNGGFL